MELDSGSSPGGPVYGGDGELTGTYRLDTSRSGMCDRLLTVLPELASFQRQRAMTLNHDWIP